jgi:hypothetical protein
MGVGDAAWLHSLSCVSALGLCSLYQWPNEAPAGRRERQER